MNKLIAFLTRLLRRLEHHGVGHPDDAMRPLQFILDELKAIEARGMAAEEKARTEAFALIDHAGNMAAKVYTARAKHEKLSALIG